MLTKETLEEAELAKNHLMNSALDERCKKSLLRLLNTATMATNGISTEEKIQKITESIYGMVLSQITFLDTVDKKIELANSEKCKTCKAMKYVTTQEEEDEKQKLIEDWKKANGIEDPHDKDDDLSDLTWVDVVKQILLKPGIWIVLSLVVISPYGVEIVKSILQFCAR